MNHRIEVEKDVSLFVQDWGKGQSIIFISGWPFDHRSWEYQFNTLPQHGFRCLGIDMRGFGMSDRPWGIYNYDIFARDVQIVLEKLQITNALLVGHSMGGAISLHYAATYGTKHISKVILCGAAAPRLSQTFDFPYGMTQQALQDLLELCYTDRAKLLTTFGDIFFYTPTSLSAELKEWFWITGMASSPYATIECIKLFQTADLRSDMEKITIPTLIAHGATDKVCAYDLGKTLHAHIKNSRMITFEKSGHGLFYDEREKFNETIINFAR